MQIPCQVVNITAEALEVRFSHRQDFRPGALLRLDRPSGDGHEGNIAVYGRIESLRLETSAAQDILATLKVVLGEPDFQLTQAKVLSPADLGAEVALLLGDADYPLVFGSDEFTVDFAEHKTLTVLQGAGLEEKLGALAHWIQALQAYQRLVIIDPLGVLDNGLMAEMPVGTSTLVKAGVDASLSLQSIGFKRFLGSLSDTLPDVIRLDAIHLLAEVLPIGQNFIPLRELLKVEGLSEKAGEAGNSRQGTSVKTLLLNSLYDVDRQRVFADSPREVFSLRTRAQSPVTILDLSSLNEPWKTLFYDEVCREILTHADGNLMPVLLYPENYLPDLEDFIKKLNEADIPALAIASPYGTDTFKGLADNRMSWNSMGDVFLEGSLTFGLPVQLDLSELPESWTVQQDNPLQAMYSRQRSPRVPKPPIAVPTEERSSVSVHQTSGQPPVQSPAHREVVVDYVGGKPIQHESTDDDTTSRVEYVSIPDNVSDRFVDDDGSGFDSILGALPEVDAEKPPAIANELGGYITHAEPEFIQQPLSEPEFIPDAVDTAPESTEVSQPEPIEDDFDFAMPEEAQAAYGQEPDDDFNFDLGLVGEIPPAVPEVASSLTLTPPVEVPLFEQEETLVESEAFSEEAEDDWGMSDWDEPADVPLANVQLEDNSEIAQPAEEAAPSSEEKEDDGFSWDDDEDDDGFGDTTPSAESQPAPDVSETVESETRPIKPEVVIPSDTVVLSEPPPIIPRSQYLAQETENAEGNMADDQGFGAKHESETEMQGEDFQVGDRVVSDKYGEGQVNKLIPMDSETAIHIVFDSGTRRTIVPSPTNLKKVGA